MARGMHKPKNLKKRRDSWTDLQPRGSTHQPGSLKK